MPPPIGYPGMPPPGMMGGIPPPGMMGGMPPPFGGPMPGYPPYNDPMM